MPIKSFKGKLSNGGIETIALHTNNGSTGYRIKKLQLMPQQPGASSVEHVVKVFKISQSTAAGTVDFSDQTLIATAFMTVGSSAGTYGNAGFESIIFDNEIFNQNQARLNEIIDIEKEDPSFGPLRTEQPLGDLQGSLNQFQMPNIDQPLFDEPSPDLTLQQTLSPTILPDELDREIAMRGSGITGLG